MSISNPRRHKRGPLEDEIRWAPHLEQAVAQSLPVRMVVATTTETEAVDQGHDASKVKKSFHVREDVQGRVIAFDGDNYTLEFRRAG